MIRKFAVTNFLSISDRQEVSFIAPADAGDYLTVSPDGSEKIFKLGIFFGPNASGKSNMLYAINNVFRLMFRSYPDRSHVIDLYYPFAIHKGQPTRFEVSFYAFGRRFDYAVEYNRTAILNEELLIYSPGEKNGNLIYKRQFVNDDVKPLIRFGNSMEMTEESRRIVESNTLNNHTLISTFGKVSLESDAQLMVTLYNWLRESFHDVDGDDVDTSLNDRLQEVCNNPDEKRMYLSMLQKADFNIIDFYCKSEPLNIPDSLRRRILDDPSISDKEKTERLVLFSSPKTIVVHSTSNGPMEIQLEMESRGTFQFIRNLKFLSQAVFGSHVELVDEISSDLHEEIVYHYLNTYLLNSRASQLIFTSQQLALLRLDYIEDYPAMAIFTEKDPDTGASYYTDGATLMNEIENNEDLTLLKAYKIGLLGSLPDVGTTYLNDSIQ